VWKSRVLDTLVVSTETFTPKRYRNSMFPRLAHLGSGPVAGPLSRVVSGYLIMPCSIRDPSKLHPAYS
jgi:hypothetical protein